MGKSYECIILGAGPAGLGAAIELSNKGVTDILIVDRNSVVGGLARTEIFDGYRFDIGPHRFFTKNEEINMLWHDTLGRDFEPVNRLTRIYYKNKHFSYPIKAIDTLIKLGTMESLQALISFVSASMGTRKEPSNFEEWITQRFGRKLYETFFKTYTEKVWGIPCNRIGAEWAAQRIKDLDIIEVIKKALFIGSQKSIKTLVEQFDYPRLGAGQMYQAMADQIVAKGIEIRLNTRVASIHHRDDRIESIDIVNAEGAKEKLSAKQFFSSLPITHFFKCLDPPASQPIQKAVDALYFRDHITVNLVVDGDDLFPDQWIYIHSPDVKMARLANYNNFSKAMVRNKRKTALSVEYFVFQHENLWKETDEQLMALAVDELDYLKLVNRHAVEQIWIVRETESYPTYYLGFQEHYRPLISRIDEFCNIYSIGRGGMYKYNNQDHSIMSGLLAARNYLKFPGSPYDLWKINIDAEYLESAERN